MNWLACLVRFIFYCRLCALAILALLPVSIAASLIFVESIYSMAGLVRSRFSLADSASNLLIEIQNSAKPAIPKTVLRRKNKEKSA
ncbi:hypothetical protein [Herbaspirillum sp. CF444]|uniref:hypothetical protein n=1 Tax=Herbaspirillum sp. CF444 TaxID=1144319 RepID=UPI0012F86C3C|nr:hypothetical protein [Herbaspirillum sp. CF444]